MKSRPICMLLLCMLLCNTLTIDCSDSQTDVDMSDQDTLTYYSDTSDNESMLDANADVLMEGSGYEGDDSIYTSSEPETESDNDNDDTFFSNEEYRHYLNLIYNLDLETYRKLKQCEFDRGKPCIEKLAPGGFPIVESGFSRADPFVRIRFPSILNMSLEEQTNILTYLINLYNTPPIHPKEIEIALLIIKRLAPELYAAIIEQDPTGEHHIKRYYGGPFAMNISEDDGLPILLVGINGIMQRPLNDIIAAIAHELGHYVLGHPFKTKPTHPHLPNVNTIYNNAHFRVQEYEADRSQVLDFGIPTIDSIAAAENIRQEINEEIPVGPQRETFKRSHPFWSYRQEHFKSLAPEVELRKAHNRGNTVFDWKKLANEYKNPQYE